MRNASRAVCAPPSRRPLRAGGLWGAEERVGSLRNMLRNMLRKFKVRRRLRRRPDLKDGAPDWSTRCQVCDGRPTVHPTGWCGGSRAVPRGCTLTGRGNQPHHFRDLPCRHDHRLSMNLGEMANNPSRWKNAGFRQRELERWLIPGPGSAQPLERSGSAAGHGSRASWSPPCWADMPPACPTRLPSATELACRSREWGAGRPADDRRGADPKLTVLISRVDRDTLAAGPAGRP
jgi:hypothetical protein